MARVLEAGVSVVAGAVSRVSGGVALRWLHLLVALLLGILPAAAAAQDAGGTLSGVVVGGDGVGVE